MTVAGPSRWKTMTSMESNTLTEHKCQGGLPVHVMNISRALCVIGLVAAFSIGSTRWQSFHHAPPLQLLQAQGTRRHTDSGSTKVPDVEKEDQDVGLSLVSY